jgi:hypothetical protein
MSEVVTSGPDIPTMRFPEQRNNSEAEILAFPDIHQEQVITGAIVSLGEKVDNGTRGVELAESIDRLVAMADTPEGRDEQNELAEIIHSADLYGNKKLYDRKETNDPIFRYLTDKLQETRQEAKNLKEQRQAALLLTELRAALPLYRTEADETWRSIIDRLFI